MPAELLLVPALEWEFLLPSECAEQHFLQPRARHATLALAALQPAGSSSTAAEQQQDCPPELLGCLVVFGGVGAGDSWLTDVTLLAVSDSGGDSCSIAALQLPHEQAAPSAGQGSVEGSAWPLAVRDFAACVCGPDAFVLTGGFDGQQQQESMQLQVCTLQQQTGAESWLRGWRASWRPLQPCNRAPLARSHHSAGWHAPSCSVLVFGGWASGGQGCLSDLQVFNMRHNEWWQLDCTGEYGPVAWEALSSHVRAKACGHQQSSCVLQGGRGRARAAATPLSSLRTVSLCMEAWTATASTWETSGGSTCAPDSGSS
jgi:hypothetical protein